MPKSLSGPDSTASVSLGAKSSKEVFAGAVVFLVSLFMIYQAAGLRRIPYQAVWLTGGLAAAMGGIAFAGGFSPLTLVFLALFLGIVGQPVHKAIKTEDFLPFLFFGALGAVFVLNLLVIAGHKQAAFAILPFFLAAYLAVQYYLWQTRPVFTGGDSSQPGSVSSSDKTKGPED